MLTPSTSSILSNALIAVVRAFWAFVGTNTERLMMTARTLSLCNIDTGGCPPVSRYLE
ncbi:hypothetical protein PF011_g22683 [Phytophthora fragariae]|uniref:Uncharacterized protein n=1 Tax=Phytophthora fragariae TaxID=53985 RepID=A0A6A3ICV0_9STRA|nr:hypothetical protein PF011_g22683 [Phytophthora fragariae]